MFHSCNAVEVCSQALSLLFKVQAIVLNLRIVSSQQKSSVLLLQAAVSVARRVAEEQGCSIGHRVGYSVRFEQRASPETRILYLTGEPMLACIPKQDISMLAGHACTGEVPVSSLPFGACCPK